MVKQLDVGLDPGRIATNVFVLIITFRKPRYSFARVYKCMDINFMRKEKNAANYYFEIKITPMRMKTREYDML